MRNRIILCAVALLMPAIGHAADFDGARLSAIWGIPFAGLLLSIAALPLLAPDFWHHHQGKVTAAWALAFALPFGLQFGAPALAASLLHAMLAEYVPFIILIAALFVVAGGIFVKGNLHGSAVLNTALLAVGALLASFMGTTGASMLMIRPVIRANDNRRHVAHVVVFFIFIVSNAGGALTPLGDPPLFLGFLKGVDFFWTLRHLWPQTAFLIGALLALFFVIDSYYFRKEGVLPRDPTPDTNRFGFIGAVNFALLAGAVGLVLMSGVWKPGVSFDVGGVELTLQGLLRDLGLLAIIALSLWLTPREAHERNHFGWGPIREVAVLFAGIFLTIIPVIAMLRAGVGGPFGPVVSLVTHPDGRPDPLMYFWITGALSSFLDNAPTYLVFFNTAGGDAQQLMSALPVTLAAISCGAVFMGANTYIGNAPNLMVKAIAEHRGVRMPSFFGYMLWSGAVLLPLFAVMGWIWFRG
jgi:Na+/H+ antiporter NhaD/arsenite permease-like protein